MGDGYTVGAFLPDQGHCIAPHRYTQAIARAFQRIGGTVLQDRIRALTVADGVATGAQGEQAHHAADQVVVAAGAWSAALLAPLGHHIPLESQRGYHIDLPASGIAIGRPIVPACYATHWRMDLPSWDRATVPLPFSRGAAVFGHPIYVPLGADEELMEAKRLEVETELNRVTDRAYALADGRDG